jgi:hypothetical protein
MNVQRRRLVLHHRDNLAGVRTRPTGAAVTAAAGVIHQLSKRNATVVVRVRAGWIFSKTYSPQQYGRIWRVVWRLRRRLRRQTARTSALKPRLFSLSDDNSL